MNEYDYAVSLKKNLEEFKNERKKTKNYICCLQYLNIEDIEKQNLNIDRLIRFCNKIGLKADYPQNLKECQENEYKGKNLIALILY